MKTAATLLASVLAVQQASATFWGSPDKYGTPSNTDNKCEDSQKKGFDWNDLDEGDFSHYKDFDFSGFKCSNSFGKRDGLSKRWGSKCITGQAGANKGPSFSCGKDKKGFSIDTFHMQSEEDHDFEFHYGMEDGSTCKHTSPCKKGGNIIKNEQCGGATSMSIVLPKTATKSCSFGVYSMSFDCSTASTSVPPKYTPPSYSTSSVPYYPTTTPESKPPVYTPSVPESSPSVPSYSQPSETPSTSEQPPYPSYSKPSVPLSTGPSYSSPASPETPTYSKPAPPTYSSPDSETPTYSAPAPPSYSAPDSETPAYSKPTPPSYSPSVPLYTGPSNTPESPVTPEKPSTPVSYPPVPTGGYPTCLPKCLNTWMYQTGCKDNGDFECYCKQPDFASKVCDCFNSNGADDMEAEKAMSFFMGICSEYVGENYGLALSCGKKPSGPPPSSYAPPASTPESPVSYPETQVTEIVTQTVTTCPVGYTVTSGSVTTTLSTPSVSTIYTTTTSTICTKCTAAPPVTSAPGAPPVYTTPAAPAAPSAPAAPPVYSPPGGSMTTISVSKTYTVPATYSTGESVGLTVPSSYTPTVIATSYEVPQVVITPGPEKSAGGLAYGPAPTPAQTTPAGAGYNPAPPVGSSGFGTTYVPKGTDVSPGSAYTGAANVNNVAAGSLGGIILAGIALAL